MIIFDNLFSCFLDSGHDNFWLNIRKGSRMTQKNINFDSRAIIEWWPDQKTFAAIPAKNLMPLVGGIQQLQRADMDILRAWKAHFRGKNIPFAITGDGGGLLTLWKERRVWD